LDATFGEVRSTSRFRSIYPIEIAIVPTLGPLEEYEQLLNDEYVQKSWQTRLSHRMFRNIWHRRSDQEFSEFRDLVEKTWPGMSIYKPELIGYAPATLRMFCKDGRFDREVYWSGFGFQVWIQFLTHLLLAGESKLLVVDEPDIYLHADLQRKLLGLVKEGSAQNILATHSV
jgi:hypothetical protein